MREPKIISVKKLSCRNYCIIFLVMLIWIFSTQNLQAQVVPANDNFANAEKIIIGNGGYALGTFTSSKVNLTKATKEAGESIHLLQYFAGTDKKTVWFVFETQAARNKTQPPNLGEVDNNLTPLSKFGSTGNTCLSPDKYFVQVSAKANANAEIWLNLVLDNASPSQFDKPSEPYEFGKLIANATRMEVGCLGIENTSELMPALGKDYNQSAWFTFSTDNYSDLLAFSFYVDQRWAGPETIQIGYRLYKGDAKNAFSKLKLVDSAIFKQACMPDNPQYCGQIGTKSYVCNVQPDTVFSIQLLFHKKSQYMLTVQAECRGERPALSSNPKKLPKAFQAGVLPTGNQTFEFKDYFACNSLMSENICGKVNTPLIIDSTVYSPQYTRIDTFDMSAWMTFEVAKNGTLQIYRNRTDCYYLYGYRIYKGDVTKNCDLPVFWKSWGAGTYTYLCMEPGTYSFQVLGKKNGQKNGCSNTITDTDIGKEIDFEIRFYDYRAQTPAIHYKPNNPEDLGDVTAQLGGGVKSQTDYYGMAVDTISIAGQKYFNRFHFRQFYISKPTYLTIEIGGDRTNNFLFSGKVSDGLQKLKTIDAATYGSSYISIDNPFRSTCTPLPAGWYTVLSYTYLYCSPTNIISDYITLGTFEFCRKNLNRPYKASYFGDVDWDASGSGTGETARQYSFANGCFDCSADTPFSNHPINTCKQPYDTTTLPKVAYYVFNLKQQSNIYINASIQDFRGRQVDVGIIQLYKGDVRKDSLNFADNSLLLAPCNRISSFCNLQPGIYTVAIFGQKAGTLIPGITVEKTGISKFDHARSAYDIGKIPPTNTEKLSAEDAFYCTTGAQYTDPDTMMNYFQYMGIKTSVPYPMPANFSLVDTANHYADRKNLWYTFTCAGTGDVKVKIYPKTVGHQGYYYDVRIYKSAKKYFGPYSKQVAAGQADSTDKQGLTLIQYYRGNAEREIEFTKKGCDTARYFIVLDRAYNYYNPENDIVQIGVRYDNVRLDGQNGDMCKTAEKFTLDKAGEKSATAIINCHSRGESFGEDGSNMSCLVRDTLKYKTTWFKFTYTGSQRVDLSFRVEENTSALPSQIHYRVLYGTCDAMTPGPCVENALSYFTLDCMGAGDYYVQVVSPEEATGEITLYAKAEPTTYPVCKPIDLLAPLSNFSYTGGCNNTPVEFINLSSAGENITYAWKFGNGKSDTAKNPVIQYKPKQFIDTFWVSLRVTNKNSSKYDEITIPVIVFRDPVTLTLAEKNIEINCSDKPKLQASSNYPYATYEWNPQRGLDNPFSATPVFTHQNRDETFTVTLRAENCILIDTVHIYIRPKILITGDTRLCYNKKGMLTASAGFTQYYWSNNKNTQTIEIDKPGKYWVTGYNNNGCSAIDSFNVSDGSYGIVNLGNDSTICAGENVILKSKTNGKNHLWSTGEKTSEITVNKAGKYWLQMDDDFCTGYDTIEIFHRIPVVDLPDTAYLCGENPVWIDIYKPSQKYLWSHGAKDGKLFLQKAGKYFVLITEDGCTSTDSVFVTPAEFPVLNIGNDTFLCGFFNFTLDAGNWKSYNWLPGYSREQQLNVNKYGRYIVKVITEQNCEISDTINILQQCDPHIWVPNAFTPYNDEPNNVFKPVLHDIASMEMKIYNRWGQLIFITHDLDKGWDGTFNGKHCTVDTYVWTIHYTGFETNEYIYGTVTLLK
ncbi:MAG: T9SS type B sorting domain-containing protein [Sphingobacteriales bacterium]|nr:MAG: T9SS type B sorting domain-containing protein [Sphingobacteriales bacterium]